MLLALLLGAAVGFVLALPPGPVSVTALKMSALDGKRPALFLSVGSAVLDVVFCSVIMLATGAALSAFGSFSIRHPISVRVLQYSVVAVFLAIGVLYVSKGEKAPERALRPKPLKTGIKENLAARGPFFLGVAIALANLASPTFLPSIAWVSVQARAFNFFKPTIVNDLFYSLGFGAGNFLWLYSISSLVYKFRSRMSLSFLNIVRKIAGASFILFGIILAYRLLTMP